MTKLATAPEEKLYARIAGILDEARSRVARSVNTEMVRAYWLIGREIVERKQKGKERADYGEGLMRRVARRLSAEFGKGFSLANLKRMKQFYLKFPRGSAIEGGSSASSLPARRKGSAVSSLSARKKGSAVSSLSTRKKSSTVSSLSLPSAAAPFPRMLSWSHYLVLLRVRTAEARAFYEIEAARESWSVRELNRQVAALLFERLTRNRKPAEVRALAREGQQVSVARDVLKDPFVLEFLDLRERASAHERDLERSIVDRLEAFLLEMGKGFCFVARQKRLTLDGDHFYVDLVFYNRLLRCFVLVDLKLGKLAHQDLGQMQMYVNFFDRFQRASHEAKTIGIVLCSEKNVAMAKITLPEDNEQILAVRYQMYLPTEEELREELAREREEVERLLLLSDGEEGCEL